MAEENGKPENKSAAQPAGDVAPVEPVVTGNTSGGDASSAPAVDAKPDKPAPVAAPKKGGGFVAGLALLLAITSLALSGWLAWKDWQQPAPAAPTVAVAAPAAAPAANLQAELERLQRQLAEQAAAAEQLAVAQASFAGDAGQHQAALANLSQRLDTMAATDRSDWKLAEVEYLLRLANQRLFTGGDVVGALALLQSADAIVRELGYADLLPLRGQLAKEIAALRRTPSLDTEGVYLQLAALSGEIDRLVFFGPPEALPGEAGDTLTLEGEDLGQQLQSGWQQALDSFSDLVRVTPRSVDIQPLLSSEQRLFLRARIRLLIEQAKNAVLLRQPRVYDESLRQARELVAAYFEAEDPATVAVLASCDQLRSQQLEAELPDISRSQAMIREYLQGRAGTGE